MNVGLIANRFDSFKKLIIGDIFKFVTERAGRVDLRPGTIIHSHHVNLSVELRFIELTAFGEHVEVRYYRSINGCEFIETSDDIELLSMDEISEIINQMH